jgi:glutathione S-transferase
VDQWLDFASNELDTFISALVYPVLGIAPADSEVEKRATTDLNDRLRILEAHLKGKKTLSGKDNVTIADISMANGLRLLFTYILAEKQTKKYTNILAWYENVTSLPAW